MRKSVLSRWARKLLQIVVNNGQVRSHREAQSESVRKEMRSMNSLSQVLRLLESCCRAACLYLKQSELQTAVTIVEEAEGPDWQPRLIR